MIQQRIKSGGREDTGRHRQRQARRKPAHPHAQLDGGQASHAVASSSCLCRSRGAQACRAGKLCELNADILYVARRRLIGLGRVRTTMPLEFSPPSWQRS